MIQNGRSEVGLSYVDTGAYSVLDESRLKSQLQQIV